MKGKCEIGSTIAIRQKIMKDKTKILVDDEVAKPRGQIFEQIVATADWTKRLLCYFFASSVAIPWNRRYDAFYDITAANPHAVDSTAYLEWERGRTAASEDFKR